MTSDRSRNGHDPSGEPSPNSEAPDTTPEEAVGRGQPPRRTRFKPGQSGNPHGRPKGARSTGTIVASVLNKPVSLTSGGRQRRIPVKEAIILRMAEAALKGDLKAAAAVLALAERYAPPTTTNPDVFSDRDDEALSASFLARLKPGHTLKD